MKKKNVSMKISAAIARLNGDPPNMGAPTVARHAGETNTNAIVITRMMGKSVPGGSYRVRVHDGGEQLLPLRPPTGGPPPPRRLANLSPVRVDE